MTTEREQLELAAKACWIEIDHWRGDMPMVNICEHDASEYQAWNPLHDDGDCARMEAQLGLSIIWFKDYVLSGKGRLQQVIDCKDHNGDKNAARRAASVAVAAEIGRLM